MAKQKKFPILYMIEVLGVSEIPEDKTVTLTELDFNKEADEEADEESLYEWIQGKYEDSAAELQTCIILNKAQLKDLNRKTAKLLFK